jgi:hypothetical protein
VPPVEAGPVARVAAFAKRQSACASPSAVGEGIVGYDTYHRAEVVKASSISPKNLKAMLRRTKNYRSVTVNDFGREKFTWERRMSEISCATRSSILRLRSAAKQPIPDAGLSPQSLALGYQSKFGTTAPSNVAFRRPRRSANHRGRSVYVLGWPAAAPGPVLAYCCASSPSDRAHYLARD